MRLALRSRDLHVTTLRNDGFGDDEALQFWGIANEADKERATKMTLTETCLKNLIEALEEARKKAEESVKGICLKKGEEEEKEKGQEVKEESVKEESNDSKPVKENGVIH
ncbi:putative mitochondrial chaperone BCS1-B-like protein [Corchorus capsularis]|uniref:Putative mitochondrial chaperone BCS1-B-like protein n=1 Tax=Corchorus capsularis TaxID=210143 RepID=A0A1R3G193_COCAP|nr:putative mitochondrial chaperone BCS1-B-like protein [Corchorus capsularis]